MKKISCAKQAWFDRRARQLPRHVRKDQRLRKAATVRVRKVTVAKFVFVDCPDVLRFLADDHRLKLFQFLRNIKGALLAGKEVKLNFEPAMEIHPCGLVILLAQLDVLLEKHQGKLSCTLPKKPVIEQLFKHIGLLERLGRSSDCVVEHDAVRFWHHHSGSNADSTSYKELTRGVRDGIQHPVKELFADCLNEAVTNTVGHAYEIKELVSLPESCQKWWMLSLLRDDVLFVAIYDLGIGIPTSLKRKKELRDILKKRTYYTDAKMLYAVVNTNWTSTRLAHRGKGLPEMVEFSKGLKAGGLSIWSRRGGVDYNAEVQKFRMHKLRDDLNGTLVLWSIPFREGKNHERQNDIN